MPGKEFYLHIQGKSDMRKVYLLYKKIHNVKSYMLKELYQEIEIFLKACKIKSVSFGCQGIVEKLHVVISNQEHNSLFVSDYVITVFVLIHFLLVTMLLLYLLVLQHIFQKAFKKDIKRKQSVFLQNDFRKLLVILKSLT